MCLRPAEVSGAAVWRVAPSGLLSGPVPVTCDKSCSPGAPPGLMNAQGLSSSPGGRWEPAELFAQECAGQRSSWMGQGNAARVPFADSAPLLSAVRLSED